MTQQSTTLSSTLLYLVLVVLLGTSCARGYNYIDPGKLSMQTKQEGKKGVYCTFQTNLHELHKNPAYIRKERNKHVQLVAVEVLNATNKPIQLDTRFFSVKRGRGELVSQLSLPEYLKTVRQKEEQFMLFYSLAGFSGGYGSTTGFHIQEVYNPVPLVVGMANALYAQASNNKLSSDLIRYDLSNKVVLPGSKVFGLIALDLNGKPASDLEISYQF